MSFNPNNDNFVAMYSTTKLKLDRAKKKLEEKDLQIESLKRDVRYYKRLSEDNYEDILADREIEVMEAFRQNSRLEFLLAVLLKIYEIPPQI